MLKIFSFTLFCFLLISGNARAQSKEELAVADVVSAFHKAMIDADQKKLENLTLNTLSYGHSSGLVDNQSQFISALVSGGTDFSSIDITNQTIQVSGEHAIVRSQFRGSLLKDGKTTELRIGLLMIWFNVKGSWKLLARQGYKL